MSNNSLIKQLNDLGRQISDAATVPYYRALEEYNSAVKSLKDELDKKTPETSERLVKIAALQKSVKEKAESFVRQERQLIDQLFKDQGSDSDACARNL
jgi:predicted  nucleic acid-binding Zn-ribbon protein